MITETRHTIVLELPKVDLPSDSHLKDYLLKLITTREAAVDYFGGELDHSFECDAADTHTHNFENKSYVSIHFKAMLDTATDKESALALIQELLQQREILEVRQDKKDVDVYI